MHIAMVGTRGVPAAYGGFETAVEEIGRRLVARGHAVTVYCRGGSAGPRSHLGMHLVQLPAVRRKSLETLTHTAVSVLDVVTRSPCEVALVFNAANAPLLPLLTARGIPVATHMDGLEWRRAKWGRVGRRYYRLAESLGVRWSDALISDAKGIAEYYRSEFDAGTDTIAYGAPVLRGVPAHRLPELGLMPGGFHVVVARFEPENHVQVAVEAMLASAARLPLVVVGAAPYADAYTTRISELAAQDQRVRLLGAVYDQEQLDQLYSHALTYVHGHSVGGTNPSLLRAMGAGTAVLAYDVNFNREVLGVDGCFWAGSDDLARHLEEAETDREATLERGARLREHASTCYRWDDVAQDYERLCQRLVSGESQRGKASGRRILPGPLTGRAQRRAAASRESSSSL